MVSSRGSHDGVRPGGRYYSWRHLYDPSSHCHCPRMCWSVLFYLNTTLPLLMGGWNIILWLILFSLSGVFTLIAVIIYAAKSDERDEGRLLNWSFGTTCTAGLLFQLNCMGLGMQAYLMSCDTRCVVPWWPWFCNTLIWLPWLPYVTMMTTSDSHDGYANHDIINLWYHCQLQVTPVMCCHNNHGTWCHDCRTDNHHAMVTAGHTCCHGDCSISDFSPW